MHIGRETDYALRIILYLVVQGPGAKVSAGRIAERMSVPERFNLKILRKLSMKGIVQSSRGIYGGFSLCRSPEELTLLEAIEAIEGPVALCRCIRDEDFCGLEADWDLCPIQEQPMEAGAALRDRLSAVTFASLSVQPLQATEA